MSAIVVASLLLPWLPGVTTTHLYDKIFLFFPEFEVSQRQLSRAWLPRVAQWHSGGMCDPIHPYDSWGISSEVSCVSAEEKQNQFLGTTRQWESFHCYSRVAQLRDLSRLALWRTVDEKGKSSENCHLELLKDLGEEKIDGGNCCR